jgi:hypothetical protein
VSVRSITFDKRKNKSLNSIDKNKLSLTRTKYNKRQLDNKLIMKHKFVEDKFVDDDFIVFNFKENGVKDDKGVHIYARPSFLKVCSYFIFSYFHNQLPVTPSGSAGVL